MTPRSDDRALVEVFYERVESYAVAAREGVASNDSELDLEFCEKTRLQQSAASLGVSQSNAGARPVTA